MTPRALRSAIAAGEMTSVDPKIYKGRAPAPPPEWPEWRRERLKVAIFAALLFLRGKTWHEIGASLKAEGMLEDSNGTVTKARIGQYVEKGVTFLMQRGCFRQVKTNSTK